MNKKTLDEIKQALAACAWRDLNPDDNAPCVELATIVGNGERWLRALVEYNEELETELREIARISAPGKAWPHERVMKVLKE